MVSKQVTPETGKDPEPCKLLKMLNPDPFFPATRSL